MTIPEILEHLDKHEIDYRLESNHCCGYIFYFLDGSVYPRRYYDNALEGTPHEVIEESVDHIIKRATSSELIKDWKHRIEAPTIPVLFAAVEAYLFTPNPTTNDTKFSDNAKKRFAAMIATMAEHNSQDAEHATEFLKSEGIDVADMVKFIPWLQELHGLYKDTTGDTEFHLNTKEARKYFDDGYTPYQTFRETFNMENDGQ